MIELQHPRRYRCGFFLVLLALLIPAPIASAQTVTGDVENLDTAQIQADKPVRLTITVPQVNPFDEASAHPNSRPVSGRNYRAVLIDGFDLTTQAGWQAAKHANLAAIQRLPEKFSQNAVTDTQGRAVFPELKIGLYLIAEVGYESESAFLVTVPTGNDGVWNYDVEIFAKQNGSEPPPAIPPTPEIPQTPAYLSVTGAQIGSAAITAGVLIAAGMGMLVTRRRKDDVR
ncbi:hypothetical protein RQN30_11625 [Arcanobacterium hippocoleae]